MLSVVIRSQLTPLGASWRGLAAGAIGTAAMDLLQFYRYRRGGGQTGLVEQEFTPGLSSFEEAPAPAKIGKRVVEGVFEHEVPDRRAALVNNVMHWSYGIGWGMPFATVAGSIGSLPTVRSGAAFGSSRSGSTTQRRWPTISPLTSPTGSRPQSPSASYHPIDSR